MTITPDTLVADVAASNPAAVKVFQHYDIDFCCGGRQPIATACEAAGVPVDQLLEELRATESRPGDGRDWTTAPLAELARHISRTYHEPQAVELERLNGMMDKVLRVHGERWPELVPQLARVLRALTQELSFHTAEEEERLFPAIVALEKGEPAALYGRALDRFLEKLEDDHFGVGRLLQELRLLTGGFVPPADACATFRALYHGLQELDDTLRRHVHLENHVLFPRAATLGRSRADAVEGV